MGTRSAVCEPYGDSYRGRYVHWDGYPSYNGRVLWALVHRDGLERVREVLIHQHFEWSSLKLDEVDDTESHYRSAYDFVAGYGNAFRAPTDWWVTPYNDGDTEWRYVLADDALWIYMGFGALPRLVHRVRWDEPEPDWAALESHLYDNAT